MDQVLDFAEVIVKAINDVAKTVITFIPNLITFINNNLDYIPNEIKVILLSAIAIIGALFLYRFLK